MSHQHYCDITGHFWTCYGSASRPPACTTHRVEPSPCLCPEHKTSMEEGVHNGCAVEMLACPAHQEQERMQLQHLLQKLEADAAALGYTEKWNRAMAMPHGPEASRLIDEVWAWMWSWVDEH